MENPDGNDFDNAVKIGLHSAQQFFGEKKLLDKSLSEDIRDSLASGEQVEQAISHYGIDLTDVQMEVMEAILGAFTKSGPNRDTGYRGNLEPVPVGQVNAISLDQTADVASVFRNLKGIPRIRLSQKELLDLLNVPRGNIYRRKKVVEALEFLSNRSYCFDYVRVAQDSSGRLIKESGGSWLKERVSVVDKLFTTKTIRSLGSERVLYYEITPSPVFLDQCEKYFMLIPNNWREEVLAVIGNRRGSSYTFQFLFYLRYVFEMKQRKKAPMNFRQKWEGIASILRMPDSLVRKNKKRTLEMLDDVYKFAKSLGYLKAYSRNGDVDCFELNEEKYHTSDEFKRVKAPGKEELLSLKEGAIVSEEVKAVLEIFFEGRSRLDPGYIRPKGAVYESQLKVFSRLLAKRKKDEIESVIRWGFSDRFWFHQISTPSKLDSKFSEVASAMALAQGKNVSKQNSKSNFEWASALEDRLMAKKIQLPWSALAEECVFHGHKPYTVPYGDDDFRQIVIEKLERCIQWRQRELHKDLSLEELASPAGN